MGFHPDHPDLFALERMNSRKEAGLHTGTEVLLLEYHGRFDFLEHFKVSFAKLLFILLRH